ncbi:MAG: DUF4301 family protein [Bacteroidetes bacterium]|nr:DUF4301 family protein [Bacteroidota bacterium]
MSFSEKDLKQIAQRGSDITVINEQIENFKSGFPFMKVNRAATINDGMIRLEQDAIDQYIGLFEKESLKKRLLKFVPASGAASRMFKSLYSAKDEGKSDKSVDEFFNRLKDFAFYKSLGQYISGNENQQTLEALLTAKGLDYGNLPKGLLEFHKYNGFTRTAIEEHLVEGALYANNKGKVRLHFTVSPEHKKKFKTLISSVIKKYEEQYSVKYDISFSEQKASTDTIAVGLDNEPFRDNGGNLLFRPAGHGALLENLNDQNADVIFIKNIDNVVPDHLKSETITYKKALAGLLLDYQKQIFYFLKRLEKPAPSHYFVSKSIRFLRNNLNIEPPKGFRNWSPEEKLAFAKDKLNRPLRICGMVKNVGEPGGGPFWALNEDGSVSLQVVESAQFDMKNKKQKEIFETATHFNPVDLLCAVKDYKKEKFDLLKFRDPKTGFITEKSQSGKVLKAQELPGLWNGSMANWNTLFVEVPLITFNPVKTVNDLLRKEHQPA